MNASRYVDQSKDYLNRYVLREDFLLAPALTADVVLPGSGTTSPTAAQFATFLAERILSKTFSLLGTNAVSADAVVSRQRRRCVFTTTTAATISASICPFVSAGYSPWKSVLWNSAKSMTFRNGDDHDRQRASRTRKAWAGNEAHQYQRRSRPTTITAALPTV